VRQVDAICEDPYDTRLSKPLHGDLASVRSSRVGQLRIIVRIEDEQLVVVVVRIGPRGDIYKS
jgi:mRNA interferase RelE/StbE